ARLAGGRRSTGRGKPALRRSREGARGQAARDRGRAGQGGRGPRAVRGPAPLAAREAQADRAPAEGVREGGRGAGGAGRQAGDGGRALTAATLGRGAPARG